MLFPLSATTHSNTNNNNNNSSSSSSLLIGRWPVYSSASLHLFIGRPRCLFPSGIPSCTLLTSRSSAILYMCMLHSVLLLCTHDVMFWIPHISRILSFLILSILVLFVILLSVFISVTSNICIVLQITRLFGLRVFYYAYHVVCIGLCLWRWSCACVGVKKLSHLTTCTVQIQLGNIILTFYLFNNCTARVNNICSLNHFIVHNKGLPKDDVQIETYRNALRNRYCSYIFCSSWTNIIKFYKMHGTNKVKAKQSRYRPGQAQRVTGS